MGSNRGETNSTKSESNSQSVPLLSNDDFYTSLESADRRRLLFYLLEENQEETAIETLATILTGWDATKTGQLHTADDRERHLLNLIHNHIPRLVEAGLITYNSEHDTVQSESLHPLIHTIIRRSIEAESDPEFPA